MDACILRHGRLSCQKNFAFIQLLSNASFGQRVNLALFKLPLILSNFLEPTLFTRIPNHKHSCLFSFSCITLEKLSFIRMHFQYISIADCDRLPSILFHIMIILMLVAQLKCTPSVRVLKRCALLYLIRLVVHVHHLSSLSFCCLDQYSSQPMLS